MDLLTNNAGIFRDFGIFVNTAEQCDAKIQEYTSSAGNQMADTAIAQYLQKEEKIMTLLRKKEQRSFCRDSVMELVRSRWELTWKASIKQIGSVLENEFLSILDGHDSFQAESAACEVLSQKLLPGLSIQPEYERRPTQLLECCCKKKPRLCIRITYMDHTTYLPVGAVFKARYEGRSKLKKDAGPYMCISNFGSFVSCLYLKNYVLEYFRKLWRESETLKAYLDLRIVGCLCKKYNLQINLDEPHNININEQALRKYQWVIYRLLFYNQGMDIVNAIFYMDMYTLQDVLKHMQEEYKQVKEESRIQKTIAGDYAKSFQTKKRIPDQYVQAMIQSGFNNYFGYVEFDEECDLKLMEELYLEYKAFSQKLSLPAYPEVSLRFRKLGNHKATGLYYPALKCLCVDIRSPASMAHEIGHMIDYHCGHISAKYCFFPIHDRYRRLLDDFILKEGNSQLKSKTKYNCAYYLQTTEVFARCFEIYLTRICKADNSLVNPRFDFAYPEDTKLEQMIGDFFSRLMKEIAQEGEEKDDKKAGCVS